jgi:hypothetical protein
VSIADDKEVRAQIDLREAKTKMSNRKVDETNFIQITFKEHKILLCMDHVNDFDKWCTVIKNIQNLKNN